MNTLHHLSGLAQRRVLPRRTVRLRLTALYGTLFLASGAGLLAITNVLARGWSWPQVSLSSVVPASSSHGGIAVVTPGPSQAGWPARVAAEHAAELNQLLAESGIALGVMAVVSVVLGWLMAGRVLRPLRVMTTAAQRISADSLHERLDVPGPRDELKDLADTIDALLERLDGAFTAQRRFTASASHELRTPLTTIRAALDVTMARPRPVPAWTAELAGLIGTQLDKVDELLEGLLVLARAQHGALPAHAVLPVDDLVSTALAAREEAITARNLTVQHLSGDEFIWVEGSQPLLHRMAGNVIDNAIGHNRDGGWISITTQTGGGVAHLIVENGGDILDPAQVAGLAQPFRRLGADRTGSVSGAGLGLSIVAAIAAAHRGTLALQARPGGGLKVSITLPLAQRAATLAGLPAGVPA
jgi:signal transduction histidine kinase